MSESDGAEPAEQAAGGVEPEAPGADHGRRQPWDPHRIRVSTKPWSLRQAIDDIREGTIDLAPDFQRTSVWNNQKRSRLVESILLGIPLPAFYFSADAQGRMQVVDGVQRLSAIDDFSLDKFALDALEYLGTLEGKRFSQLDPSHKRRIHQTQIFVNVIEPETPPEVKFNIFRRINTGGEPLTAQEIRHALSQERSRKFLKALTKLEAFGRATDGAFLNETRMADRELALRFVALVLDPDLIRYAASETVDDFLIAATRRLDDPADLPDSELDRLGALFANSLDLAFQLFGEHAFRRWSTNAQRRAPINRALFENWTVALASRRSEDLVPRRDAIVSALREAFTSNREYINAITAATSDLARVRTRFAVAQRILDEAGQP